MALITVTVVLLVRRPRHAVTWVLVAYTVTAHVVVGGRAIGECPLATDRDKTSEPQLGEMLAHV